MTLESRPFRQAPSSSLSGLRRLDCGTRQPAKVAPFAGGNGGGRLALMSEKRPQASFSNRLAARRTCACAFPPPAQPAKTTLFAGGNEAVVRKTATGQF